MYRRFGDPPNILLDHSSADALATVIPRIEAAAEGRRLCHRLKEVLDRQQFEVVIQAALGSKIVARETVCPWALVTGFAAAATDRTLADRHTQIKPYRKDVTAKCYGGDVSRKRKLLERQKEGKKRLKMIGRIEVPNEAFQVILKKEA